LTGLVGVVLVGCALLVLGLAVSEGGLSDLGWLVVVVLLLAGSLTLWRAAAWNKPIYCRRCNAALSRDDVACPRCGLDLEKTVWATIGTFKLP
jgi:hypothetical protein